MSADVRNGWWEAWRFATWLEDARMLARYYQGLWKAARTQLGNVKYFLKSFRL